MTDNVMPTQASKPTLDIVREWTMSGDHPVSSWEQGFADAIDNHIADAALGLADKIATQAAEIARLRVALGDLRASMTAIQSSDSRRAGPAALVSLWLAIIDAALSAQPDDQGAG